MDHVKGAVKELKSDVKELGMKIDRKFEDLVNKIDRKFDWVDNKSDRLIYSFLGGLVLKGGFDFYINEQNKQSAKVA